MNTLHTTEAQSPIVLYLNDQKHTAALRLVPFNADLRRLQIRNRGERWPKVNKSAAREQEQRGFRRWAVSHCVSYLGNQALSTLQRPQTHTELHLQFLITSTNDAAVPKGHKASSLKGQVLLRVAPVGFTRRWLFEGQHCATKPAGAGPHIWANKAAWWDILLRVYLTGSTRGPLAFCLSTWQCVLLLRRCLIKSLFWSPSRSNHPSLYTHNLIN